MILETVIFTALPTARTANSLALSCFIAPQLGGVEGNPTRLPLSRYVDFADGAWAGIIRQMSWQVVLRYSPDDSDEVFLDASRISPDPDAALSRVLFPSDMPVDPFTFENPGDRKMLSFPMARLSAALDDLQARVVRESPEDRPTNASLVTRYQKDGQRPPDNLPLDPFNLDPQRRASLNRTIDAQLADGGVTRAPKIGTPNATALSVEMLNRMLTMQATPEQMQVPPRWPDLDFHQAVSMLGSHPLLLRKLGFIVDLRVDLRGLPLRTGAISVYVGSSWPGGYDPDVKGVDITTSFPRVATRLSNSIFRPRATGTTLSDDGFVDMSSLVGVTSEVEIETQATQTQATAISRADQNELTSFGTPQRTGLAARHSSGIALVQTDYAASLQSVMQLQNASWELLLNGDEIPVSAEDVLVGYRLDVRRVGQANWRTVHRRHGVLTPYVRRLAQASVDLGDDENWVEPAGTSDVDDAAPLRIAETIARWSGWSLAFAPPGKLLNESSEAADPARAADAWAVIDTLHGAIDYSAPASGAQLPTLRFATTDYEFRLRWVDVAGNSVGVGSAGGNTLRVPYRRHDPVPAPGIYLAADPVWGESVDVVVVRTAALAADSLRTSTRYVAPPSTSAALALAHGMFDDATGRPRPDMYDTIALRESAALSGQQLPANPGTVPYLADPLAQGLFVRGVPTGGATYDADITLPYGGTWPALNVRDLVVDTNEVAGARIRAGKLVIGLAPGRVAYLRLSNSLDQAGLELMDLWRRTATPAQLGRAKAGAWWALTPDRTLVVVHASQQPMRAPAFVIAGPAAQLWRASRVAGDAAASLSGKVNVDKPSTESVNVSATATVFIDNGPGTGTPHVDLAQEAGVLGTVTVEDPAPGGAAADVWALLRAPFNDTRRVALDLTATATSRFAEYFRKEQSFVASIDPVVVNGGQAVVEGAVRVTYRTVAKGKQITATERQYSFNADTATFQRLSAGVPLKDQIPIGATVTVSYLPQPVTRTSAEVANAARRSVRVTVPSSARPLAPEIVQVLPLFHWGNPTSADPTSTRVGGGLRIYLKRPWGSSGLDEDLAVLTRRAGAGQGHLPADDFVARWGQDPTTLSVNPPAGHDQAQFPRLSHFTNRSGQAAGKRLAEFDANVDAALFSVGRYDGTGAVTGYDSARDLWFVDIEIDQGSAYRPFIQLALARYQAQSVPGLELSPVVLADVMQLEPNRLLTFTVTNGRLVSTVDLTLTGPTYTANELGSGPGIAVAILEEYVGPAGNANTMSSAAWRQVSTLDLRGRIEGTNTGSWTGHLNVNVNRTRGQYRVVIEQYETLRTDGSRTATARLTAAEKSAYTGRRLVHQDMFLVPVVPRPKA